MANQDDALAGVKVLELAESVAAPYCSKLLADLGAEVIKIEKPGFGDESRKRGPFPSEIPHPERSGLFLYLNTNKLGITLDIESATGKRIFNKLIQHSDILIEDNPPDLMERVGLTYQQLKTLNPRLVMTSITPFGQTGPYRDYKAYPVNVHHSSGEGYLTPTGSKFLYRPPVNMGKYAVDYQVGIISAGATLVALYHSKSSGSGQHLDISKQEALLYLNQNDFPRYLNLGLLPTRMNRGYRVAGVYPCLDGYVLFYYHRPEEWKAMLEIAGSPDGLRDETMGDQSSDEQRADEIVPLLRKAFQSQTKAEIFRKARAKKVAIVPCNTIKEVVESEQLEARGFFLDVMHEGAGILKLPSGPCKFSKTPFRVRCRAPFLGEHNEEIYLNRLGYSKKDFVRMRQGGII